MKTFKITTLLLVLSVTIINCKSEPKSIKQQEVTFTKEGELTLYKSTTDTIITKIDIEIAKTPFEIETGLMYRKAMKKNQGMLFVFNEILKILLYHLITLNISPRNFTKLQKYKQILRHI